MTPGLKGQNAIGHCDGSRSGEKRKEGSTDGVLRGWGGGGICAEGDMGQHRERCGPARPPERGVRPQTTAHPIL